MQIRFTGYSWQKPIWKILKNPAFEVVAAIVVVLIAAWIVISTEVELRERHSPAVFGTK
jgi:ABC-type nickel/cobalt efflux system permease component RcnA